MQTSEKTQRFSTMTSRQMFTRWWEERWVRIFVLGLTPVGVIDAVFTILLFHELGVSYEYNPIVRIALVSEWWIVWFLMDAISFALFIMLAGSYYIHTRSSLAQNRTGLVSALVAMRVGLAAHNVIRFYGIFPGILGGVLIGLITYIIVDGLLDRTNDVTWQGFKQWWKHITDRFHDYRLIQKANRGDENQLDEQVEKEIDDELKNTAEPDEPSVPGVWRKRILYLLAAGALFLVMPYFLVFLANVTGVSAFSEIYGPLVFWNELSAPAFLLGFVAICIFTASIMYLVLRSFEVEGGAW